MLPRTRIGPTDRAVVQPSPGPGQLRGNRCRGDRCPLDRLPDKARSGDDIDIFVLSPSGTQPDGFPNAGFCAWHDYTSSSSGNIPYTNMPYVLDAGSSCGANSVQNQLDGFSIVGGHEYAEAITDPEPASGWVDSSGQGIGDKCAWQNLSTLSLSTGTFAVQPLWSNNDSGCTLSAP